MISALSNIITNSRIVGIAQSTNGAVTCKTAVNSIGRPGFILIDNNIDHETKKFAATKEFLYQGASLLTYIMLIVPIFKKGAFKVAKKYIFKGEEGFSKFKGMNEYLEYRKLAEKPLNDRNLEKSRLKYKFEHDNLRDDLKNNANPEKYNKIHGAIELGSLIGSIIGLSILAPNISQALTRPVLKALGFDQKNKDSQKVDTKA